MLTFNEYLVEKRIAQDKDIKGRKGTQPKKYYTKMSKSTKKERDEHFKSMSKRPDNDDSAYGPAPGDKGAKTKESKYTKAYKKRFGEAVDLENLDDEFFMEEVDQSFLTEFELDEDELELINEDKIAGLVKKSEKSGVPYGILKQVYNRGMAAWKGGHRPGTTPQQWAFARVNSFLSGGKTRTTADKDLWSKASAAKKRKKKK